MGNETEDREIVLRQEDGSDQPTEYYVVRKRKGRHKARHSRRALVADSPQQKFRLILLLLVVFLIVVYLVGGGTIRQFVSVTIRNARLAIPTGFTEKYLRPELLLLVLAALIILYLMVPGIESRVLRLFGIRSSGEASRNRR